MLHDIRNEFRTGDISVYPLVILSSNNPNAGKVKIVSAKKADKWHEVDHHGDTPMNSWNDVLMFMDAQIEILTELNALTYINKEEAREKYEEINPSAKIKGIDQEDFIEIGCDGISSNAMFIDINEDSPRYESGYWQPILDAWVFSKNKISDLFENGSLREI